MSNSHKGSKLSLSKNIVPIDNNTVFLAHYDISPNCVIYGTEPISDISTLKSFEGKFGGGIAVEEGTTNLVPESKNRYPSYGNTHGTYNTNQYNSNTSFSIGTIDNITNNIVTLATVDHAIYTYDVLNPDTTGGGVTAGVDYFIKKHSSNSFSLHAYDSSQDGSKGFAVHDSIKNDVRVAINAIDFPLKWHGAPHKPNSALVKEIVLNGFNYNGVEHDCIRLHTWHKPEGATDGMAYGVYPQVVSGNSYTFSFYYRAVTPETVGKSLNMTLHTSSGWGGKTITIDNLGYWKKYEMTSTAPNTGGTNMYWWLQKDMTLDIAEIQCENKTFSTSFADDTRGSGILEYPQEIVDFRQGTISIWAKTHQLSTSKYLFYQWDTTGSGASHFGLFMDSSGKINFHYGNTDYLVSPNSYNDGEWHNYVVTWVDGTSDRKLYIDGKLVSSATTAITMQNSGGRKHGAIPIGHRGWTYRDLHWNGIIDEVRIDKVSRTDKEIEGWYISQLPFYPKGIYRLAY